MDLQDLLDLQAPPGLLEIVVYLDFLAQLDRLAKEDPKEHRVSGVTLVNLEKKAHLDLLVCKVLLVL